MEILKFENAPAPRKSAPKKSNLKSLAGLATVAAVAVLGSTLAANISLGTGSALEFGQGVQVTAACDSGITISPRVTFVNTSGGGTFYLSTVSFTNVDMRAANSASVNDANSNAGTGCGGRTLTLNGYGDSSATPLQLATASSIGGTPISTATIGLVSGSTPVPTTGLVIANQANTSAATASFDLGFGQWPSATSGAVIKLTLQSN